jgi:DNA-binding NtrC family response regulator
LTETILLVDDDIKMKSTVAEFLHHEGFKIVTAMNGRDAIDLLEKNQVNVALLDIKLPDIDGVELLKQITARKPHIPVIMISGYATIDKAVSAMKLGAYGFLEKPIEPQRFILTIRNALEKEHLEKNQRALVGEMMGHYGIIGVSDLLTKLCISATRVAKMDTPVLITGDNGSGKELFANVIHQSSGRSPLVCVNCAAIPRDLIESELFGHKKGAFTGASTDKVGKFQAANGGTLFLDEIGDMGNEMQAKILRSLETNQICMVGGNEVEKVDVRVIAATNKNLLEEIKNNNFREDLYYRLRGVTLHVPPLRERPEDIEPLATFFIEKFCKERNIPVKRLTDTAVDKLRSQEWRGNVRELKHFVQTLVIFGDDVIIDHLDVLTQLHSFTRINGNSNGNSDHSSLLESTRSFEINLIAQELKETHGNISQAAARLHVDRATLSKKIKRLGLKGT